MILQQWYVSVMKSSQTVRHFLYGQYAEASRNNMIKIVIEKWISIFFLGEGVASHFFVISNYPWFIFSLEQTQVDIFKYDFNSVKIRTVVRP